MSKREGTPQAQPTKEQLQESVELQSLSALNTYFSAAPEQTAANADRAHRATTGLKFLAVQARKEASRTNRAAIILAAARTLGLRTDALLPVWRDLTGTDPTHFLPAPTKEGN